MFQAFQSCHILKIATTRADHAFNRKFKFQGSRKFRQELGRAVQKQSKVDPDSDAFREAVEEAIALMPDEALDEPVGDTPEDALGVHIVEA